MQASTEYRYNRLTWPEMNEAIAMQKVVILPTGFNGAAWAASAAGCGCCFCRNRCVWK